MWFKQPLSLLAIFVAFAVGFGMGARWIGESYQAQLAKLKAAHAENRAAVAEASQARLIAAQKHAETLTLRLYQSEQMRFIQAQEHQREIKRLTRGVPCLNAGTVRLLNRTTGIQPAAMPETTGQPVAENAAAATDTDVANWIDSAIRQYDTCRDQLGALIDFHQGE